MWLRCARPLATTALRPAQACGYVDMNHLVALKALVDGPGYGREVQKRQSDLSTMVVRNLENLDVYKTIIHAKSDVGHFESMEKRTFKELLLEMLGVSNVSYNAKANLLTGLIFTVCKPEHFNITRLDFMKIFNSTCAMLRAKGSRQKETHDTLFNQDHCNVYLGDQRFLASLIDQFAQKCNSAVKSTCKSRILVRQNLDILKLYLVFFSIILSIHGANKSNYALPEDSEIGANSFFDSLMMLLKLTMADKRVWEEAIKVKSSTTVSILCMLMNVIMLYTKFKNDNSERRVFSNILYTSIIDPQTKFNEANEICNFFLLGNCYHELELVFILKLLHVHAVNMRDFESGQEIDGVRLGFTSSHVERLLCLYFIQIKSVPVLLPLIFTHAVRIDIDETPFNDDANMDKFIQLIRDEDIATKGAVLKKLGPIFENRQSASARKQYKKEQAVINTDVGGSAFQLLRPKKHEGVYSKVKSKRAVKSMGYAHVKYGNKIQLTCATRFLLNRLSAFVDIYKGLAHNDGGQLHAVESCLEAVKNICNSSLMHECHVCVLGMSNREGLQSRIEKMNGILQTTPATPAVDSCNGVQVSAPQTKRHRHYYHRKLSHCIDEPLIAPVPPQVLGKDTEIRVATRPQTSSGLVNRGRQRRQIGSRKSRIYY